MLSAWNSAECSLCIRAHDGKGPGGTEWAAGGSELSLGKSFPSSLKGLEEGTEGLQTKGLIWLFPLCCQPRTFLPALLGQMSRAIFCLCLWNCGTFAWGPWGRLQQIIGLKIILCFLCGSLCSVSFLVNFFFFFTFKLYFLKNYFLNFLFCIGVKPTNNAVIASSE